MAEVHPSAILGPDVQLADDVSIGPWCKIDGPVKIGAGTRLLHQVSLHGPLTIGRNNTFYPSSCIGYAPQDYKFDAKTLGAGVTIGDENIFREGANIHRATQDQPTRIGHQNMFMAHSHIAHDCVVGNQNIFGNSVLVAGHAEISDQTIYGGNAVVHQFARVGRLALVSGVAGIKLDLPPFCICYISRHLGSLNIIGLRRAGHRDNIPALKKAFDIIFRQGLARTHACDQAEKAAEGDPLCQEMIDFIRESKNGVCTYAPRQEHR